MKLKGSLIFISILSILILSIGMVSAEDVNDAIDDVQLDTIEDQTIQSDDNAQVDTIEENSIDDVSIDDSVNKKSNEKIKTAKQRIKTKFNYEDMVTTAIVEAYEGRTGDYFNITLLDENNKPLAGKEVQIGFNGKAYKRNTSDTGGARLQINLPAAGTYTFAICYLGDDDYESSFEVAKITVNVKKMTLTVPNKSYKASAKTKSLTATLKDNKGNLIRGKKITFVVNGYYYSATTNSKGVATVKVTLSTKKTYSFTAKFAGDKSFGAVTKTAKVVIK